MRHLLFVLCFLLLASWPSSAFAEQLYSENFDAGESTLAGWQDVLFQGSESAATGDLVLTGSKALLITGVPEVQELPGTSIRAQIAFEGPSSSGIGLLANGDPDALTAYQAGYNPTAKRLYLGWNSSSYQGFAVEDVDFGLTEGEELILQFDAFDNQLELSAWRPGESKPLTPQLTHLDDTVLLAPGFPGVLFDTEGDFTSKATFRYIQVDNVPIPEPSACAIAILGGLGLLVVRRRRFRTR